MEATGNEDDVRYVASTRNACEPVGAGAPPNVAAKVKETKQAYARAVETIRADRSLSPEGKAERIAKAWRATSEEIQRLRVEYQKAREQHRQDLERSVFGPTYPHGATEADKVAVRSDYRAALDRAEQVQGAEQAADLLDRAELTSDTVLARAVATVAASRGFTNVLEKYADSRPEARAAIDELVGFQSDKKTRFVEGMVLSGPMRPSEVTPQIENAVAQDAA